MENTEIELLRNKVCCYEKQIADMQAHIDFLKAELQEVQCYSDELKQEWEVENWLPSEPIDVASKLIKAVVTVKTIPVRKASVHNSQDEYEIEKYSKRDLRKIAEHLLVYCNK